MFIKALKKKVIRSLSPRQHIIFDYVRAHRRWPNLDNPRTFNEKIAWRKLHEFDPRMPDLVDKVKAKEIIARKFGAQYVIPTLAVYKSAAELDFTKPPLSNPPYVLKANHGTGFNIFVREMPQDPDAIRKKLDDFLKIDYEHVLEEWAYSKVERKILVEPFVQTPEGFIPDYKCHVFGGSLFAIELVIDRFKDYWINLYDRNWKLLDVERYARRPRYDGHVAPPARLAEMVTLAEAMAEDFPYVRVDLYEIAGELKFGELTFYPGGGYDELEPAEWNLKFGDMWKLRAVK